MSEPSHKKPSRHRGASIADTVERGQGGTCPAGGEDETCSDEVKHGRQAEDPAMLDGTLIDAGAGIAGLVPIDLPPAPEGGDAAKGGGCGGCR